MKLSLAEARDLAVAVLTRHDVSAENAAIVADALVLAEADGIASHGLSRLAAYSDQARAGKVNGHAVPALSRPKPAALFVDAGTGYAFPALARGLDEAVRLAPEMGVVAVAVGNSHHFGVAGHHVERVARAGLVGLGLGNAPAAIAPWGGSKPLFGTNPIAFAAPWEGHDPLVIDLSLSKVARGKIMVAAQKGEPIPEGWALDPEGRPTTDAKAAMAGAMLPMGDAKGAALVMMVELLAAAFTGAHFGFEASSFFDDKGPAPRTGQFFLVIDPNGFGGRAFTDRMAALMGAVSDQPGTRIPGRRRFELRRRSEADGIAVPDALFADLQKRAGRG
ncbi:MAG TPA: Ldh family oxidoreductase [Alphaproteobacteria bacterium]|nr:Ldh family oxidoreductase [Alphaproteobacteria bacterium]